MQHAKYSLGQIIHHRKFDYRGVIFDMDAAFSGTEAWYATVAKSNPPKDEPWYHVLVDNSHQTTYVAERNIETTYSVTPINHPLINHYFNNFIDGHYLHNNTNN
ncbi:MAG: heat shock protein HspQ [Gammaproteobacteria bacterium]|jgi:heat shock protein HspQ